MDTVVIDVREKDEFETERVEHSINIPLSRFLDTAPDIISHLEGKPILLMCKSGKRSSLALDQLKSIGVPTQNCSVYRGGITEWKNENKQVVQLKSHPISIMRQVQLVAGSLVLGGTLLTLFVHPNFLLVPALVGAGLIFAGASGFCGMAMLLAKMPWNR